MAQISCAIPVMRVTMVTTARRSAISGGSQPWQSELLPSAYYLWPWLSAVLVCEGGTEEETPCVLLYTIDGSYGDKEGEETRSEGGERKRIIKERSLHYCVGKWVHQIGWRSTDQH